MIKVEDILKCVEDNKAPHIRLFDMNKNLLHTYDEYENVDTAVDHLKTVLPIFSGYGKIIVNCATPAMKSRRWTGSYNMVCVFDKAAATQIQGPQFNAWQMPPGYVSNEVMMAKLETLEKTFALNKQIDQLTREKENISKEDPLKQIERIAPWAMLAMGKDMEQITKVATVMKIGNANISAPAAPTNSLTFSDIEKKPLQEKEKIFQALIDSVSKKVAMESMIELYSAIDQDPSLVQTALQALPLLKKP